MDQFNVYKDMKARTNGEIYIGVVGPVCIKIRKTKNPSVVQLDLVRRPCVQGKIFDGFDQCIHMKVFPLWLCI